MTSRIRISVSLNGILETPSIYKFVSDNWQPHFNSPANIKRYIWYLYL